MVNQFLYVLLLLLLLLLPLLLLLLLYYLIYYFTSAYKDDRDLFAERPRLIIIREVSMDKYNGERDILYILCSRFRSFIRSSDLTCASACIPCVYTHFYFIENVVRTLCVKKSSISNDVSHYKISRRHWLWREEKSLIWIIILLLYSRI